MFSEKDLTYNKACVGTPIIHRSDYAMLPEGSVVISSSYRKIRNIVSHIEEHHFEVLKVKHADGRIESMYLPMKDDAQADIYNEIVPGTSITANMLLYLMFNRFQMSTPAYREVKNRLSDMDWNTSPQNLLNCRQRCNAAQQADTRPQEDSPSEQCQSSPFLYVS